MCSQQRASRERSLKHLNSEIDYANEELQRLRKQQKQLEGWSFTTIAVIAFAIVPMRRIVSQYAPLG